MGEPALYVLELGTDGGGDGWDRLTTAEEQDAGGGGPAPDAGGSGPGSPDPGPVALTVLVVEDDPGVRRQLRTGLELAGDFVVVGEAAGADEAVRLVRSLRPECVVVDLGGGTGGLPLVSRLRDASPRTRVVVYSADLGLLVATTAVTLGASAVVDRTAGLETLKKQLRSPFPRN